MTNSSKAKKRGFITYKSYLFREKDPIIDCIRTARSDAHMSYQELHEQSGVSISSLRNWEHGDVRKPQFATVMATINALGKKLVTKNGKPFLID